ncbi:Metallo-dependent phosphatase-like protein [Mycena sp. CBHHK59/15]|nr:Metallo-dependent phosphatase-like protein [Mycena sp. CBHHK59/15]
MVAFGSTRNRLVVNGLRLFWTVLALQEHVVFLHSVHKCAWPDSDVQARPSAPTHVLIVADPQILDHRSYPDRAPSLTFISQLLVDLNLRKSWRAALRTRPDVVVFLGDMMDGGRFSMSDAEYERYFQRFKSIFPLDAFIPQYFIPGNHDTGLGASPQFSEKARARYSSHFGPPNSQVKIANHTIVLLDAPAIVEEDFQRAGYGQSYSDWKSIPGGPIEFVKSFAKSKDQDPVVLFTHIPLSRPDGANCGPNRERGTIRRGVGFGYQNTLGKTASDFLLENISPSVVFSGDDHDYCEYTHSFGRAESPRHAREVTVKSLSMAMGIRRPGFQLLSLAPPHSVHSDLSHADSLCLLPDQLGIYLSLYIPLLVISILLILVANATRVCSSRRFPRHTSSKSTDSPTYAPLTRGLRSRVDSDAGRTGDGWLQYPSDADDTLPQPSLSSRKQSRPAYSRSFVLLGRRRRTTIGSETVSSLAHTIFSCCDSRDVPKSRGFAAGMLYDTRDVAVFPLGIFTILSVWMFR